MKKKALAIMIEDLSWMYYGKYKKYLIELEHPFKDKIDFVFDFKMNLSKEFICEYHTVIFYHRDPMKYLYPEVYLYAKQLQLFCNTNGIAFVNNPDSLSRTSKKEQLSLLNKSGVLVAKVFDFNKITDLSKLNEKYYPLFIRNNYGHDSDNLAMQGPFYNYSELIDKYKEREFKTKHLEGNIAVQWIDTRSKDGMYRRYRAFATKSRAIPGNIWVSREWYIHGVNAIKEPNYIAENDVFQHTSLMDHEIELFTNINRILDLDFSAIDYAFNQKGEIVVWEANPHPAFPGWVDKEPIKTQVTNLLSDLYNDILS